MAPVVTEWKEHTAIVTINRPEVHNALNMPALQALQSAIETLTDHPKARAVIITGAGEKAFAREPTSRSAARWMTGRFAVLSG